MRTIWFSNWNLRVFHENGKHPYPGGMGTKKIYYGEAPPRGPIPYPFIFGRKGTPFVSVKNSD